MSESKSKYTRDMSPSYSQKKGDFTTMDDEEEENENSPETVAAKSSMKSINTPFPVLNQIKKKVK